MAELMNNYDFDPALQGNTYDAVLFNMPEEAEFSLVGAAIYMQLRKKPNQIVTSEFSTVNQKLEILSDYSFSFKTQIIDLVPDTYDYDILIVFASGRRETYIGGKWTIQSVITLKK